MARDRLLSVRLTAEETSFDKKKNAVHLHTRKNLCKTSAEKLVCGAKSEPVGNLSGFAGKTRK